ncbi:hypothetical protein O3G_MSEX002394 [Manduca sexta]|uniref:alpha-glucosidase n=2 Tax=Manduca sexta TaxID=7130 RepID=A0A922CEJ9_MANSE|nr:hypothetical protein O3G_MSEX002394 [Manduca sexta]
MSEPRKNRLSIDGGQVKDDEHVASYKPIPDAESEFRTSKSSLAKSKEKISADGAEEKLLQKEDEAKIVTRVDMADAKYVVGDHRNGDAKIELDANKKDFSGLTKEELMKYADDPFWVNLRWSLFVLFWASWLCMLAGAIVIIVQAPKCTPPEPKKWYEQGPLVELGPASPDDVEAMLPRLEEYSVQGVFMETPVYEVLDQPDILKPFKNMFEKARNVGIKVVVDLLPSFVSLNHTWFQLSENRTAPYTDYFVWAPSKGFDDVGAPIAPNNWISTNNTPAWSYSEKRREMYLHQYDEQRPDLNFLNKDVADHLDKVISAWITSGAAGVRLLKARHLIVNVSAEAVPNSGRGSDPGVDHTHRAFWRHSPDPRLTQLLGHFAAQVKAISEPDAVFTVKEESEPELELFMSLHNMSSLRPPSAAPLHVSTHLDQLVSTINARLPSWPAIKLVANETDEELAAFSLLLPAAPVLELQQLSEHGNETKTSSWLSHVVPLRWDVTVEHGAYSVAAAPPRNRTHNQLLVCARWKAGHTGYVAVYNPGAEELRGNLSAVPSLPDSLTVHHVSHRVRLYTNFTSNHAMAADDVLVPPRSTLVLSYVPKTSAEQ